MARSSVKPEYEPTATAIRPTGVTIARAELARLLAIEAAARAWLDSRPRATRASISTADAAADLAAALEVPRS